MAEGLARIGVRELVLIDHDVVEEHNLDRLLNAGIQDIGRAKTGVAASAVRRASSAEGISVIDIRERIQHNAAYAAARDCDILVCCVDSPVARDVVNRIAFRDAIPVVDGGVEIRKSPQTGNVNAARWKAHVINPYNECLELVDGDGGQLVGARLELRQQRLDVAGGGGEQAPADRLGRRALAGERPVEQVERPSLGLAGVRLERAGAPRRLGPARGDGHDLLCSRSAPRPYSDSRPSRIAFTLRRSSSSRAISPASMVLPSPVSSAMNRLTRGSFSALRGGSIWYASMRMPARNGDWKSCGSVAVVQCQRRVWRNAAKRRGGSKPREPRSAQSSAATICRSGS